MKESLWSYGRGTCLSVAVGILAVGLYLVPSPIDPPPYTFPSPLPRLVGPLLKNVILQQAERLFEGRVKGPESFAVDENGTLYTGMADGKIVSFRGENLTVLSVTGEDHPECGTFDYEPVCGRPKGMKIGPDGYLYFVDCYKGLGRLDLKTHEITILVPSARGVDGLPFKFLNSLDISDQGDVYFTDSSSKWERRNFRYEVLETHPLGRVLRYNIATGDVATVLDGLYLANGIALSKDKTFLVISEMSVARIRRVYVTGPKAGTWDILTDNLPGYPDNIKLNSRGNFYVGMASVRFEGASPIGSFLDVIGPLPALKRFIAKVTPFALYNVFMPKHALAVELSEQGEIISSLHDPGAIKIGAVSELFEYNHSVYIGHYDSPYVGKLQTIHMPNGNL